MSLYHTEAELAANVLKKEELFFKVFDKSILLTKLQETEN